MNCLSFEEKNLFDLKVRERFYQVVVRKGKCEIIEYEVLVRYKKGRIAVIDTSKRKRMKLNGNIVLMRTKGADRYYLIDNLPRHFHLNLINQRNNSII